MTLPVCCLFSSSDAVWLLTAVVAKQNHGQVAKALGEAEQIARKLRQIATILLADFERRSDDEYLLYEQPLRLEMEELRKCEKFAETMIEKVRLAGPFFC